MNYYGTYKPGNTDYPEKVADCEAGLFVPCVVAGYDVVEFEVEGTLRYFLLLEDEPAVEVYAGTIFRNPVPIEVFNPGEGWDEYSDRRDLK
jgi:hypothetical protein